MSVRFPAVRSGSKRSGNSRGISNILNQDALSLDCSMIIAINRMANWSIWSVSFIWFVWVL